MIKEDIMAKDKNYELHDVVEMKKPHPCGNNAWRVIRMGADIRIKCQGCGQSVLMPRRDFEKKMNTRLEKASETE